MAKATQKAPAIENFLSDVMGVNRTATIAANTCVCCHQAATQFRDELSRREYRISGMCQKCQDGVFNVQH